MKTQRRIKCHRIAANKQKTECNMILMQFSYIYIMKITLSQKNVPRSVSQL